MSLSLVCGFIRTSSVSSANSLPVCSPDLFYRRVKNCQYYYVRTHQVYESLTDCLSESRQRSWLTIRKCLGPIWCRTWLKMPWDTLSVHLFSPTSKSVFKLVIEPSACEGFSFTFDLISSNLNVDLDLWDLMCIKLKLVLFVRNCVCMCTYFYPGVVCSTTTRPRTTLTPLFHTAPGYVIVPLQNLYSVPLVHFHNPGTH